MRRTIHPLRGGRAGVREVECSSPTQWKAAVNAHSRRSARFADAAGARAVSRPQRCAKPERVDLSASFSARSRAADGDRPRSWNASGFIPLTMIPLTELAVGNANGHADLAPGNRRKADAQGKPVRAGIFIVSQSPNQRSSVGATSSNLALRNIPKGFQHVAQGWPQSGLPWVDDHQIKTPTGFQQPDGASGVATPLGSLG